MVVHDMRNPTTSIKLGLGHIINILSLIQNAYFRQLGGLDKFFDPLIELAGESASPSKREPFFCDPMINESIQDLLTKFQVLKEEIQLGNKAQVDLLTKSEKLS
mmetsp:Transcript_12173/g.18813  ORF Transcript_12173/g.18813 Transcript_12173/m.18813 type:complete len:104 (+) Transcript_12173:699-1010(+)